MVSTSLFSLESPDRLAHKTTNGASSMMIPGSRNTSKIVETLPDPAKAHSEMFVGSYGIVYANDLANAELTKSVPDYPVGAMLVREKHPSDLFLVPTDVIAMVKREKGFSKKTGDWEFFRFSGDTMEATLRETKGSCSECHSQVKDQDWVFKTYIK